MLKNITLSADETLIELARKRAAAENTTLNAKFRLWLEKYAQGVKNAKAFAQLMTRFDYVNPGQSFSRDELNER